MAEKDKDAKTEEKGIDAKHLKGLMYTGATHAEVTDKKTGKKKMVHTPFERALAPADVLSFKDYGDTIVLVARDGKKYEVKK